MHQEEVPLRGTNPARTGSRRHAVRSVPVDNSTYSERSGNSERSGADERKLLRRVYELAVRTRRLDERLWILYRQGAAGFVLTARGHEVARSRAHWRCGRGSTMPGRTTGIWVSP